MVGLSPKLFPQFELVVDRKLLPQQQKRTNSQHFEWLTEIIIQKHFMFLRNNEKIYNICQKPAECPRQFSTGGKNYIKGSLLLSPIRAPKSRQHKYVHANG